MKKIIFIAVLIVSFFVLLGLFLAAGFYPRLPSEQEMSKKWSVEARKGTEQFRNATKGMSFSQAVGAQLKNIQAEYNDEKFFLKHYLSEYGSPTIIIKDSYGKNVFWADRYLFPKRFMRYTFRIGDKIEERDHRYNYKRDYKLKDFFVTKNYFLPTSVVSLRQIGTVNSILYLPHGKEYVVPPIEDVCRDLSSEKPAIRHKAIYDLLYYVVIREDRVKNYIVGDVIKGLEKYPNDEIYKEYGLLLLSKATEKRSLEDMYKWWDVHKKYPNRLIKTNPHYDSVYTPKTQQEIEVAELAKEFVWAYINLDKEHVRSMVLNPDAVDLQKFDTLYDKLAAIKDNLPIKKDDIAITWVVIPLGKSVMATATLKIVYGDSVFDYTLMFARADNQWKIESFYGQWFTIPEILDKVKSDRDKLEEFKDKKYETPKGALKFGSTVEDIYKIYDPTDESYYEKSNNKEAITFKNKYAKDDSAVTFYVIDNKIQSWREHSLNERAQNISREVSNPRNLMLKQMNLKQDTGPAQELRAGTEKEQMLDEVQTGFGRIAKGMTIAEVEKMLPLTSRAFKNDTRMGYKDITIYDNNWRGHPVGLWIELENDKVKSMKIVK